LGKTVAFFSLEMAAHQVIDRWALRRAGRNGIGGDQFANSQVVAQIEEIGRQRHIHLFDAQTCNTIAQIESQCRLLAASPMGLALVVVDYLQLVTPPADSKREPREQQVAQMTRRFKLLADTLACPVILLAQLNRESEKEERRPRLSDLRESGSIEQDADRVWFIYRPKLAEHEPLPPEDASEIKVALYQSKCRNGPAGVEAILRFNRPCFSFG
jgi:replicative DNA helicase